MLMVALIAAALAAAPTALAVNADPALLALGALVVLLRKRPT